MEAQGDTDQWAKERTNAPKHWMFHNKQGLALCGSIIQVDDVLINK